MKLHLEMELKISISHKEAAIFISTNSTDPEQSIKDVLGSSEDVQFMQTHFARWHLKGAPQSQYLFYSE